MRTRPLWFGLVAMMLAVTPAHAGKVDWSEYIDKRAAANTNVPAATTPVVAESDPAPKPQVSKRTARSTKAKATTSKAKPKARTKVKKTRRK